MMRSASEAPKTPRLRRDLGLVGLAAAGIGSMVGAGINIVPFALQRSVPGIGEYVLPAYLLAAVPAVLAALVRDPAAADARAALGITGFQTLPIDTYQVCVDIRLQAQALGYAELA